MGNFIFRTTVFVLLLSTFIAGCDGLFTTPINKILEAPRSYSGKTVKISGEVTEVVSLVVAKYFTVQDKTGKIIVVTERPLPKEGTKIVVSGIVQEAFSIGDEQLIVVVENKER